MDSFQLSNDDASFEIEVCVENFQEGLWAQKNGAAQIELCSRLDLDGLTPSIANIEKCLRELSIPTKVLIRPKGGGFVYTAPYLNLIRLEIEVCKDLGVSEIVIGLIRANKSLDEETLFKLRDLAHPMDVSINKAIDDCDNVLEATEVLVEEGGFKSLLSSGGMHTAWQGRKKLKEMIAISNNRINIIPAGKIIPQNLSKVHEAIGATIYHGRNILGSP